MSGCESVFWHSAHVEGIIVFQSRYNSISIQMSLTYVRHTKDWLIFQSKWKKKKISYACSYAFTLSLLSSVVRLINCSSLILLFHWWKRKPESRGDRAGEGRTSLVGHAEDAKVNNTQHALRGKCGNAGVRGEAARALVWWAGRPQGMQGVERNGSASRRTGLCMIQREIVLTAWGSVECERD